MESLKHREEDGDSDLMKMKFFISYARWVRRELKDKERKEIRERSSSAGEMKGKDVEDNVCPRS